MSKQLKEVIKTKVVTASKVVQAVKEAPTQAVAVFARLKPLNKGEERGEIKVRTQQSEKGETERAISIKNLEFNLEWVFEEQETQEQIYKVTTSDRVTDVLGGKNATILAYGQTGSGKTHTMFGPQEVLADFMRCEAGQRGIVPRACMQIFDSLAKDKEQKAGARRFVRCTYIEVYNDRLNDLLGGQTDLKLQESAGDGVIISGVHEQEVNDTKTVMEALVTGNSRRVVAAMKMNDRSSRGHAILCLQVVEPGRLGAEKSTKLNLVDLAGMESSKKSYAVEGASNSPARREEAKNINVSLYALGSVIEKLSAAGQSGHIPYRNSKLTRLLQDALGGNSRCVIVVTVRTEAQNVDESIATLRLARRAAVVKTVSKESTVTVKDPTKLFGEINHLSTQLERQQEAVLALQAQLAQRDAMEAQVMEERKAAVEREAELKAKQEAERLAEERKLEEERRAKWEEERKAELKAAEDLRATAEEARKQATEAVSRVEAARKEEQAKAAEQAAEVRGEALRNSSSEEFEL
mgnify:CR=1 FL=1